MCGRSACTLSPANIRRACRYRDRNNKLKEPEWRDAPCGGQYRPSANIPPTAYTPVLLAPSKAEEERVLQPMMWGLVPPWHHGPDPKSHKLSTSNARIEGVQKSNLYRPCLKQRCVILCDGFYEWKRDEPVKQPYLIYARQKPGVKIEDCLEYNKPPDHPTDEDEWKGPELLKMAGLYSIWREGGSGPPVYSYTVLTRDSGSVLGWMHDRIPCLLTSEAAVSAWLDPSTPVPEALALLELAPAQTISYHPVATAVGNVKNQDLTLILPVELATVPTKSPGERKKKVLTTAASQNLMTSWLKSKEPKEEPTVKQEPVSSPQVKKEAKGGSEAMLAGWLKKQPSKRKLEDESADVKEESGQDEESPTSKKKKEM